MLLSKIERLLETLGLMDSTADHVVCAVDLRNYEEVSEAVSKIARNGQKISGLINSAGISTIEPINALTPSKILAAFETNVVGNLNI